MTPTPAQRTVRDIAPAHPEVEFALVLARTIDSVSSDPQQLRSAVYELARQKLQQLAHEDPAEKQRLMQALEVAIEGVEAHTKSNVIEKFEVPPARALPAFLERRAPRGGSRRRPRSMPRRPLSRPSIASSPPRCRAVRDGRRRRRCVTLSCWRSSG
ncbi:hypothetical protein QIH87_32740 [Bradyrhizobium elkanii]|uniref:hypothetical protein n=1 Tax=Bradyrhizobium elkanii TaxID=29448 RepID=UPI00271553E0|nr:hypothetical protein [Bradyrhizobium elkanii]WLB06843.1 hypothetical protein QIH87_32740 [Bradyrhizobium elkanii]